MDKRQIGRNHETDSQHRKRNAQRTKPRVMKARSFIGHMKFAKHQARLHETGLQPPLNAVDHFRCLLVWNFREN
ncbi:hypothetical protein VF724_18680 [Paenibacillaceae bacterium T2]|uniref:Transposase n=1 Tax=Ferviditalea candida TaxID=3108399 RepID=A0ABU5ZPH8_9BACL|nr:hypothetical protein [Paenibacillaceae bacterium T2]